MAEELVRLVIEGEPVPKARPRVFKGHAVTPERTAAAEARVAWAMRQAYRGEPFTGPLVVELRFFRAARRRADLDNFCKLVLDAGNGVLWVDDSQIQELRLSQVGDHEHPRTVLLLNCAETRQDAF